MSAHVTAHRQNSFFSKITLLKIFLVIFYQPNLIEILLYKPFKFE